MAFRYRGETPLLQSVAARVNVRWENRAVNGAGKLAFVVAGLVEAGQRSAGVTDPGYRAGSSSRTS
jgi:hypothetical protein